MRFSFTTANASEIKAIRRLRNTKGTIRVAKRRRIREKASLFGKLLKSPNMSIYWFSKYASRC
jgi:hypothetical protein